MRALLLALCACGRVGFTGEGDAAPIGHDEDRDAVADVDDRCPHVADDQADADGDGVGDACDPEPALPRQALRFFDPFLASDPAWGEPPVLVGDAMVLAGAAGSEQIGLPGSTRNVLVELGGAITAIGPTRQQLFLAIRTDEVTPAEQDYIEIIDEAGTGRRRTLMHYTDPDYDAYDNFFEAALVENGAVMLRLETYDDLVRATTRYGGVDSVLEGFPRGSRPGDLVGIYAEAVDLRVDYVVVISTTR